MVVHAPILPIDAQDERLWTKRGTASFLGVAVQTLDRWRYAGRGPQAKRVGGLIRYRPQDVHRWVAAQKTLGER